MANVEWWRGLLTIADLGIYGADEIAKLDPEAVSRTKEALGFNAEHLTCSDVYGGEKGVFYFNSDLAREVPRDFLGEYVPRARDHGIRVLIYYNVHWLQEDYARGHPEWLQVESSGRVIDNLYGSGCAPCVNSVWRDWSFRGIEDLAAYEIDGIFLDGPIFTPSACYCEACQRIFRERFGAEIPRDQDWSNPLWRDFIEFRYDSIATYLRDARAVLKRARPSAMLYMNCTGLSPGWPAARDNRRLVPHQDILGAEGGFLYYDLRKAHLWKPGMTAKLLETQAGGKPTVIFIAGANKGWDEYLLTGAETRLLYADTVANGASPWYGIPLHLANRAGALAAGEMNRFLLRNAEFFEGSLPLARVGLLWSSRTADFYRASVPVTDFTPQGEALEKRQAAGNFSASFAGCYEALLRSHVPFRVVDEAFLTEGDLKDLDLIVLPNCACLSAGEAKALDSYVREGGNVVASFETSMYDEYGLAKGGFQLEKVFGVRLTTGTFGPMKLDYMRTVEGSAELTGDLSSDLLPCPVYGIGVEACGGRAIAIYLEKMRSRYSRLPPLSENPAIVANRYGKGSCLYFAGSFFEHYSEYHNPDYRRIVAAAASAASDPIVSLLNCPRSVEMVLRAQPARERLLVHLVNFTAEMTRPIESVIRLSDIGIRIRDLPSPVIAKALRLGRELKTTERDGGRVIELPELGEYEVICLEPYRVRS